MLDRFINIVSGLILGLAPVVLMTLFSITVYEFSPNVTGIIAICFIMILSFWVGIKMFNSIQIIGPFEFMTALDATKDLDDLMPNQESSTNTCSPEEFPILLMEDKLEIKKGSIRIYGHWFGKPYRTFYDLRSASYNPKNQRLTLNFGQQVMIYIEHPGTITVSPSFIKISRSKQVRLSWASIDQKGSTAVTHIIEFEKTKYKVKTSTNILHKNLRIDVSAGHPAVMIFGPIHD